MILANGLRIHRNTPAIGNLAGDKIRSMRIISVNECHTIIRYLLYDGLLLDLVLQELINLLL